MPPDRSATPLVGRESELDLLTAFVVRTSDHGGALLLAGDPGVGKTALLNAAAALAQDNGMQVLRAAGAEFEADLPYSAMHQSLVGLVRPPGLPAEQHDALAVAFGLGQGPPPARMAVCAAALELLIGAARERPVLLIVDDLPWIDRASAQAFGFIARRVAGHPVGFLASSRTEAEDFFDRTDLDQHDIQPLAEKSAHDLLQARFPGIGPGPRSRILQEAQGNPLALLELPVGGFAVGVGSDPGQAPVLPLTSKLRRHFVVRIGRLPANTRAVLLLLALGSTDDLFLLSEVSTDPALDLEPAARAGLVGLDQVRGTARIRHPLIRSAVVSDATTADRRAAHAALARLTSDEPDRRAWHLAEAAARPDDQVADGLESAAHRILARGDTAAGVTALMRAGSLSPDRAVRSRRIAAAAYIGANAAGNLHDVADLLASARSHTPDGDRTLEAAIAAAFALLDGDGDISTAHRLLVEAIQASGRRRDPKDPMVIETLLVLFSVCLWAERDDLFPPCDAAVTDLGRHIPMTLWLQVNVLRDPARVSAPALQRLDRAIAQLDRETDVVKIERVVRAATYVDRIRGCRTVLSRVVDDARRGGAVGTGIALLMQLCVDEYFAGRWTAVQALADEGAALCGDHGFGLNRWCFEFGAALVAAGRGDRGRVEYITERMLAWATPRGVGGVKSFAYHARALDALAQADWDGAYDWAVRISPAGELPPRIGSALWIALPLVESAVYAHRRAEAEAHVAALQQAEVARISPRTELTVTAARALIEPGEAGLDLFSRAVSVDGAQQWPFELARVRLAYGRRLRHDRSIAAARDQLARALQTFQSLDARPWITFACTELRAAGGIPRRNYASTASLTSQELQVAQLAAIGLTNKQIADQLFLSPRTISAHLYRTFPKLGVTTRAALRDALNARSIA